MKLPSLRFSPLCQISCRKQQTPEILNRAVHILIRQLLTDFFRDFFTCHQFLNLHLCCTHIRHLNKTSDRVVATGVAPVILRLCLRVGTNLTAAADNIPWTININGTKTVSIIPLSDLFIMFIHFVIIKKLSDFPVCKAKMLLEFHIRNGQHPQIIQPRKNTLLRDTHTSRQHRHEQISVRFQPLLKHIPYQHDHLIIISLLKRFRKRHVILINQENDLSSMMFLEQS